MKYKIEANADGSYTLYSIVETSFGGIAKNFICQGGYEYCGSILDLLNKDQPC